MTIGIGVQAAGVRVGAVRMSNGERAQDAAARDLERSGEASRDLRRGTEQATPAGATAPGPIERLLDTPSPLDRLR